MGKRIDKFDEVLKSLEEFELPDYKELPEIPLYMEQVVAYIKEKLLDFFDEDSQIITPFMVNNYVKAKMIEPPKDKKYSKDHIGYLIAISILKTCASMRDIATFIDLDQKTNPLGDKQNLYSFFKNIESDSLNSVIHKVKARNEVFKKNYQNKKGKKNSESEDDLEKINLSYIALRLYIESSANKIIADKIMKELSSEVLPKEVFKEDDVIKIDKRKTSIEAKKLADRKKKKKGEVKKWKEF